MAQPKAGAGGWQNAPSNDIARLMSRLVHIIEHWDTPPDAGQKFLVAQGFDVRVHHPWNGDPVPKVTGGEAGVLVMGGPQMVSAHEKWPYLADEFALIEQAMRQDVPLIGVCLGSQMIAHVLGAKVNYGDDPEALSMGFYETRSPADGFMPTSMMTLNGNAQGWELPHGATLLARSDQTLHPNQAFSYDNKVLGLQFHPEVTREIFDLWHAYYGHLIGRPGTQTQVAQNEGFAKWQNEAIEWYEDILTERFQTHRPT
ncbi:MAG: gamma-glutamyl-gamma-aminobutyrate hydrolase family protein [Pseudomonadota bacterium]